MFIFLGTDGNRGGQGPTLLAYNKLTDEVQNRGPLFPANSPYSYATGEGWYFSGTQPTTLYTFLVGGTQLRRYDVVARQFEAVPALDLAECRRRGICPSNAAYIFQPHSSDDDLVHSATVQNAAFERLGCVVYGKRFTYFSKPAGYGLDECHVDKSGHWLALLETTPAGVLNTGSWTCGEEPSRRSRTPRERWGTWIWALAMQSAPTTTIRSRTPPSSSNFR